MKWKYGDSWEKFPIEKSEVWGDKDSRIQVLNWMKSSIPDWMRADMVYCDPPWNLGNVNTFYTKAEEGYYENCFKKFSERLFENIKIINPKICYLEIGKQNVSLFKSKLEKLFPSVQKWEITYYKKNPCFLLRGSEKETNLDFTGMDDEETPFLACSENINSVADLCTGRGLTLLAALENGKVFYGTELNKRRLAVAIEKAHNKGKTYEHILSSET